MLGETEAKLEIWIVADMPAMGKMTAIAVNGEGDDNDDDGDADGLWLVAHGLMATTSMKDMAWQS